MTAPATPPTAAPSTTPRPIAARAAPPAARPGWQSIGLWLAGIACVYVLVNVIRAMANPAGFVEAFGLPAGQFAGFVDVYAVRSAFLGLFGLALIQQRQVRALELFALIGALMPLGDAAIVARSGGEAAVIARHLAIALGLLLTWFLLRRWRLAAA